MRPIHQLVHSRTRVEPRFALMPLEGFPDSRLPSWPTAKVKVLASPRIGAEFVMYLIDVPTNGYGNFFAEEGIETFYYVLSGKGGFNGHPAPGTGEPNHGSLKRDAAVTQSISEGSYGLMPAGRHSHFVGVTDLKLLVLRKRFEQAPGIAAPEELHGHESKIEKSVWADDKGALLQTLIPDDLKFDLAMNIFTFEPGHGLPIVETHVMEHGALILEGKGIYYLGNEWMEVEAGDFIYMAPFCPQSFYATGTRAAKYIYYKNVNREIVI